MNIYMNSRVLNTSDLLSIEIQPNISSKNKTTRKNTIDSHLTITFTRSDAGERKFYLQSWSTLDSKLIEQKIRRHKNLESRCWAKTDHLIPSLLRDEAAQNKN